MPDSPLRRNPILAILKKFIGSHRPGTVRPAEYVFSLDPRKRRLYLLDLKAILRLPDARLALPNLANLEITIRRNRERIRIPCDAMLPLVRELRTVRHRLPSRSPLVEIMRAMPGLTSAGSGVAEPSSSALEGGDTGIRLPPIPPAEQEAEVARIRELIAHRKPARQTRLQGDMRADPPAAALRHVSPGPADVLHSGFATGIENLQSMSAADPRRQLETSVPLIESVALSTHELSDGDMSGYIDLCIINGDHQRVLTMLVERVAEQPRAWAWARLLALAEALRDPRFDALCAAFLDWVRDKHAELLPDTPAAGELLYGVRKQALRAMENSEIAASVAAWGPVGAGAIARA
jgi:hypothetical protein